MSRKRILISGMIGCILSAAGLGLTVFIFFGEERAVSAKVTEQVRLDICLMGEEEYEKAQVTELLPGQTIEREPVIVVDGESPDVYIRVWLSFGGILGEAEEESGEERRERLARIRELEDGIDFCEGWLEGEDGFYYYQEKVEHGSLVPVYDRIAVPEKWDNRIANKTFTIELSAEAVRADRLEPWLPAGGEKILSWD